jgi:hypothetical protein
MQPNLNRLTPQARQVGLLSSPLKDELVIYDTQREQAHSLNRLAWLVWQRCDGNTEVGQMASLLTAELQAPVDEEIVWLALKQLDQHHLLLERLPKVQPTLSRRAAVRRLGVAAAVALPLVTSMLIPPAAAAASGCGTAMAACGSGLPACCPGLNCIGGQCL